MFFAVGPAPAQSPLPDDFNPGANSTVYALAVQADGKILVGGAFISLGGQPRNRIARLNADGTLDSEFSPGADGAVYSLVIQMSGKILVGGEFTKLAGQPRDRIGRLNADGALDSTFNPGADDWVECLTVQADGKILVGGWFTTLGGQPRNRIARLNVDGTLDAGFEPSADSYVNSLAVQPDGKILVGGSFTNLTGQTRRRIARLNPDGTTDSGFNPGADWDVYGLALQADGKILVGGGFTTLDEQPCSYLGRLNTNGTLDSGFHPGASDSVSSLAVQTDGRILVAGRFTTLDGQPHSYLSRLNADGTADHAFDVGADSSVHSLAIQADGKILVAGWFRAVAGQPRDYLARLNNTESATQSLSYDASTITWLRGGASPEVWRTTFDLSTNGADWINLGAGRRTGAGWELTGASIPAASTIRARGEVTGGDRNASGWFVETFSGRPVFLFQPARRTNNPGTATTFSVTAVGSEPLSFQWFKDGVPLVDEGNLTGTVTAVLRLTNVLGADAGGYRVVVSNGFGVATSVVATLTVVDPMITAQPVSQTWNAGQSVTLSVTAMGTAPMNYQWWKDGVALASDIGASLTLTNLQTCDAGQYQVVVSNQYGSVTSAVALLTVNLVTVDSGFDPETGGIDPSVHSLAVQPDGKILVGGGFTSLCGQPRTNIARLGADGTLDNGFHPGGTGPSYSDVDSLAVQPDGKILVGGWFTEMGGQPHTNLARLNADGTLDGGFNPGADDAVCAVVVQMDGSILVGGSFTAVGGQPRTNTARLHADGALDSSFNLGTGETYLWTYPFVCSLAIQPDGKILVGGGFSSLGGQPRNCIARLNADGTLDSAFKPDVSGCISPDGVPYVQSIAAQPDGKVLVGGYFTTLNGQPRNCIGRLNGDGTLDSEYDPEVEGSDPCVASLAVQADGETVVGGWFTEVGGQPRTNLARLKADGTLDSTFNPGARAVRSLALQSDGKILAGGRFTILGGQARSCLGRLNNTAPATQSLSYDGSTITWLRGGTSPEVWRTHFEVSTNGSDWISLGEGSRLFDLPARQAGGWQLTGISLPPDSTLRARGYVSDGVSNWFVETVRPTLAILSPVILTGDSSFGVVSNCFGFTVRGVDGQMVVVEGSSNLVHWTSLSTNAVNSSGRLYFSDGDWNGTPVRFYRRLWP